MKCEEECKEIGYCPYIDLSDEGLPCGCESFEEFEKKMFEAKIWIREQMQEPK